MVAVKRNLIPLALALALAIVGAALAVPSITLHIQELDAGTGTITQTVHHAYINWKISDDGKYVTSAIIKLTDDQGNVVGSAHDTVYLIIDNTKYTATYDSNSGVYKVDFTSGGQSSGIPIDGDHLNSVTVVFEGQEVSS